MPDPKTLSADYLLEIALILLHQGQEQRACVLMTSICDLYPGSAAARKAAETVSQRAAEKVNDLVRRKPR